jgi:flagellar biosynthesis GTPase FlhF
MNGQAFERATGEALQRLGWTVSYTPRTGDFGADIIAHCGPKKLVVQCKDYASAIAGFDALKEVHFARSHYKADEALIVSKKGFSRPVRAAAGAQNVGLLTLADLKRGCEYDRSEEWARIQTAKRHEQERFEAAQQVERRRLEEQRRRREEEERRREDEAARAQRKQEEQKIREGWHQYDRRLEKYQSKLPRWQLYRFPLMCACVVAVIVLFHTGSRTPPDATAMLMALGLATAGAILAYLYPGLKPSAPAERRPDFARPTQPQKLGSQQRAAISESHPSSVSQGSTETGRVVEACPACGTQLRLPAGREGVVRCPTCGTQSYKRT